MKRRGNRVWIVEMLETRLVLSASFDITGLTTLRNDPAFSSIDGSGIGIAILDTGVYAKNPELTPNVAAYYNAVENAIPSSIGSSSVAKAVDNDGHGTHVSGIAASSNPEIGVAYNAKLVDVKVIADSGETQLSGDPLLRGLQFVAEYANQFNIKVVNMSLGESDSSGGVNDNSVPQADDIAREIQTLETMGITVVAAAGNSYANDPAPGESYPAVVSTISVANVWSDSGAGYDFDTYSYGTPYDNWAAFEDSASADQFSATSQRSTLANQVAAPGMDIYSDWNNSSADNGGNDLLHNTLSGTSMAAPFVSGMVALIQQAALTYGGRYITDPNEVLEIIKETSDVITDSNVADNGRVQISNGELVSSQTSNLPETGDMFDRVNVYRAIQEVKELFSGPTSTTDTDDTTTTATMVPAIDGTQAFNEQGVIGRDGLNQVGANDVDVYQLTLSSPGTLTIAMSEPGGGTAFTGAIRLFDSSGNQIGEADGTGSAGYPTLTTSATVPLAVGTYYAGISSAGNVNYNVLDGSGAAGGSSTGDYVVTLGISNPDPNGVAQGAVDVDLSDPDTILSGNVVANEYNGDLGSDPAPDGSDTRISVPNGDVDMFKVIAPDTGMLTVQTDTSQLSIFEAKADTYVRVFDANLNQIAFNDDISRFDTDSYVQVPVTLGQTYYVAVTNFANRSFDPSNPYDRVAKSTATDSFYNLYLSFNNGDQNGTALLADSEAVGTTIQDAIGSDNGTAVLGANGGFKDIDWYTYDPFTSGLLDLSMTSETSGFTPTLQLWTLSSDDSSITQIGSATGSGSHLIYQIAAGQTVYVSAAGLGDVNFNWFSLASGSGGETGAYSLTSALRPNSDLSSLNDGSIRNGTPQTIALGQIVSNNLGQDNGLIVGNTDVDLYAFVPTATGGYDIRTNTTQEGSADTLLRLFDANGNQIASNDNASSSTTASFLRVGLTAGQTYYFGVSGSGNDSYNALTGTGTSAGSTGNYVLTVTTANLPGISIADAAPVREPMQGQSADASFLVSLDETPSSEVTVDYATASGTAIAGQDFQATSGMLTFEPGQTSMTVLVPILSDVKAESNETFSLVLSNPSSNSIMLNNTGTGTILDLTIQTRTFDASHVLTYMDASGERVVMRLTGPGSGSALFYSSTSDPTQITLDATTTKSSFSVTPAKGTTSLGDIEVNGSLASVSAKQADLKGDFSVTGSVGEVSFSNVTQGTWTIDGSARSIWVRSTAASWMATVAGDVGTFVDAGVLAGDLTVRSARLIQAGEISGANLRATETSATSKSTPTIGTLSSGDAISNSDVRSAGNIGVVKGKALIDSQIFAGVGDGVSALPAAAGDLVADAVIKSVNFAGGRGNPFAMAGSDIAAGELDNVVLGDVNTDNGGVIFGVAGEVLRHYSRIINGRRVITLPGAGMTLNDGGDAVARNLG